VALSLRDSGLVGFLGIESGLVTFSFEGGLVGCLGGREGGLMGGVDLNGRRSTSRVREHASRARKRNDTKIVLIGITIIDISCLPI
jgi:hypothetical protein